MNRETATVIVTVETRCIASLPPRNVILPKRNVISPPRNVISPPRNVILHLELNDRRNNFPNTSLQFAVVGDR